mmetsp:Transcript_7854/g.21883  ORF Transcript_7854/g.21883 Transcript_7854/m.21883 type:complete len:241 (+) Transcript_7854:3950-4672(+)
MPHQRLRHRHGSGVGRDSGTILSQQRRFQRVGVPCGCQIALHESVTPGPRSNGVVCHARLPDWIVASDASEPSPSRSQHVGRLRWNCHSQRRNEWPRRKPNSSYHRRQQRRGRLHSHAPGGSRNCESGRSASCHWSIFRPLFVPSAHLSCASALFHHLGRKCTKEHAPLRLGCAGSGCARCLYGGEQLSGRTPFQCLLRMDPQRRHWIVPPRVDSGFARSVRWNACLAMIDNCWNPSRVA